MSEHIVHTAVYEDCLNLMIASPEISEDFKSIAENYRDFGQLGSITKYGDAFSFKLLEEYKKKWADRAPEDLLEAKLAFVFGWVSHRAADREMKPVWSLGPIKEISKQIGLKPTECSIYHESYIFREYYFNEPTFSTAILPEQQDTLSSSLHINNEALVKLMRGVVKRSLIEFHTFRPDCDDINGWFEKLYNTQQIFKVDIKRYSDAILNPDPEKVKMYITDINFFDAKDPVITLCKRLRNGDAVTPHDVKSAVEADNASHYAKAVILGFNYLRAASDYYKGVFDIDTLKDKLDIGKKVPGVGEV
mgnify:CR=1 FL=1